MVNGRRLITLFAPLGRMAVANSFHRCVSDSASANDDDHSKRGCGFRTPALLNCIQEVGADRLLFSADYPFEDMLEAATWFDGVELNENDLHKIAYANAARLFGLDK